MKIFENKNINSKVIEYFKCVFLLTVIIECLLILFSSWKKKKYTFYYVRNLKYYLHTISNKEVICSYNRNLNKKNGYTIEKIDEIKQNRLFWEYESDAYLYLRDVLTQNRVKVLQYQEIIDKTAEKLQSDLEVEFIDEVDVPIHYWGVVYIIETFKMKNLDKKLGRLEEKENYKYHIIKTNDKNRYLLLIYNIRKKSSKKIYTNKLDEYIENIASVLEYNPKEDSKKL